jgi:YD repeat-containing protein
MKKTANFGTMYPRVKLNLNSSTGPSICTTTGATALTTTLAEYTLNCAISSAVSLTPPDRFYLWTGVNLATAPGNKSVKAELDIEGTLNGNYDSRIAVLLSVPPPFISLLSPVAGPIGTSVTITGANFGGTQGSSTVRFNGVLATVSSWTNNSILASVPAGASSGLVMVTVNGTASNGQTFLVFVPGSLGGTVSRASNGTPITGALVEALQSGLVKASNVSGGNGSYALTNLAPGVYDLRVSATSYGTAFRTGIIVGDGGSTTSNIALFIAGSISGKVTKTDGTTPIASATLKLYQGSTTVASASTNASGDYVVSALDPGLYTAEATAAGYKANNQSGIVVSEGITTPMNLSLGLAGPISYVYDELGRLVSVVDSTGDMASFSYDAVGNLLSIQRQSSTLVSVTEFSPNSGWIGATVRIYGTGFSSTPGQNVVKFNGVTAAVTSANSTEIVASVPSGATTGPISVDAPGGSASSITNFTVANVASQPSITGFTPTIDWPGNNITIAGANFEITPSNNRVSFYNHVLTAVSSASSTSITAKIPLGTISGRIAVATPFGTAVSVNDFFVPPVQFPISWVEVKDRMAIGESRAYSITGYEHIALVLFEGTLGHGMKLDASNITIPSGWIWIYQPNGTLMAITTHGLTGAVMQVGTLPATGTYQMVIDTKGIYLGNLTLTLTDVPPNVVGTIGSAGPVVNVTTTTPQQNASLSFNGTAAQRISLEMSNVFNLAGSQVSILNPNGTALASTTVGSTGGSINDLLLPSTGLYSILVDPQGNAVGGMTLALYNSPPDVTGTMVVGGGSANPTTTIPGQKMRLTFPGTSGQRFSLEISDLTFPDGAGVFIYKPDGTVLDSLAVNTFISNQPPLIMGAYTFPTTGTYTILVDPTSFYTGNTILKLYSVPSDITGSLSINGSAVQVTITAPGQNAKLTFSGNSGQQVTVRGTNNTMPVWVGLLKPDGTLMVASGGAPGIPTFDLPSATLPSNGTYTVSIDPTDGSVGSLSVRVTSP